MEIEEKSRMLFMKYAVPCAGTLVQRGSARQEYVDMLIAAVKNNRPIPKDAERIFKVAFAACSLIAKDSGKKEIDADIVHQYFLFGHDTAVSKRYGEMGDFDPQACRIRPGVVRKMGNGFAVVENSLGRSRYKADYCDVKEGDLVVTHWDFIVEKIDRATTEKMKKQKKQLQVL
ncbi:MAG: hypothetical protein HYU56_05010 [Candidatus Aenigmarchaeota archaeon]|nr:hypothetical protein [Candidatus Aenigmarchaeota archaeon]